MASIVLGGIGYYFGGPLGYMIGSYLGSQIDPQKLPGQEGPRLGDLSVQSSTYGQAIPITFGTTRLAGNLIWSSPIKELRHDENVSGGKGGGSTQQTQTTYTYSVDCAFALCEGEIFQLGRIWADGKIFKADTDTSTPDLWAVLLGQIASRAYAMRVYLGTETQEPDPLIESYVGVGNAPAYRGMAYVVFENLQLKKYGNRIPNFTFEVIKSGTIKKTAEILSWEIGPDSEYGGLIEYGGRLWAYGGGDVGMHNAQWWTVDGVHWYQERDADWPANVNFDIVLHNGMLVKIDPGNSNRYDNVWRSTDGLNWVPSFYQPLVNQQPPQPWGSADQLWLSISFGGYIYRLGATGSIWRSTDAVTWTKYLDAADATITASMFTMASESGLAELNGEVFLIGVWSADNSSRVYSTTDFVNWTRRTDPPFTINTSYHENTQYAALVGERLYIINEVNQRIWYTTDGDTWTDTGQEWAGINSLLPASYRDQLVFITSTGTGQFYTGVFGAYYEQKQPGSDLLSNIVTAICARAGITQAEIDVSELTDTVNGYTISNTSNGRAALEPLMSAFHFDSAETQGAVKFPKRGRAVDKVIAWDDLAAANDEAGRPSTLKVTRAQEVELPREVTIKYLSIARDYQEGSQRTQRLTTRSIQQQSISLPIALGDDAARQISDIALYEAWVGRITFEFAVNSSYIELEPGDVISIPTDNTASTLMRARISRLDFQPPSILQVRAVQDDDAIYTSYLAGDAGSALLSGVEGDTPSALVIMDGPILRDLDNDAGFYFAASGYASGWPGCRIFQSSDGGATWTPIGSVATPAAIGEARTTGAAGMNPRIWDNASILTVDLYSGSLASSPDLSVLNGANAAMWGAPGRWELIHFANAVLNADGTYTVSRLLRGRAGTEWAMNQHAARDKFVLLTTSSVQRLALDASAIGLTRIFKAVTDGHTLDYALPVTETQTAAGLMPLSGVHGRGRRNAGGDLTISWIPRTRIAGGWLDGADAPIGEDSEAYEIDIMSGTTVKRTLAATTRSAVYSQADQIADFGTAQAAVKVRIYQISATVGRGYKYEVTL